MQPCQPRLLHHLSCGLNGPRPSSQINKAVCGYGHLHKGGEETLRENNGERGRDHSSGTRSGEVPRIHQQKDVEEWAMKNIPGRANFSNAEPSFKRDHGVCQELLGRVVELGLVTHETEN